MSEVVRILRNRLKIADNHLVTLRRHLVVHLAVGLAVMAVLIAGGTSFFHLLFFQVTQLEDFGEVLVNHLVGMVMMVFFSMLVFSNLIVTLSTTYVSHEVEFLMGQPVRHRSIFFVKLAESAIYSSWGFAILAVPFFLAFGHTRPVHVGVSFYGGTALLLIPFILIPAVIGGILAMVLNAILPARRTLKWTVLVVFLGVAATLGVLRLTGVGSALFRGDIQNFTKILELLQMGYSLWAPHTWVTQGILAVARGDWHAWAYWLAMLASTALMLMQVAAWLAPRLYYRGWCLARQSPSQRGPGAGRAGRCFDWFERGLGSLSPSMRALVLKDVKVFWRDPTQWSQLIILFGILVLYMANLRSAYFQRGATSFFASVWTVVLSLFNLAAICFVLSILTTRFVYPMLSLEGKEFWIIGLAPVQRTRVVWQKYALSWVTAVVVTESLALFSNWMLHGTSVFMEILSCVTVLLVSFGLTSLAVGLGAATPNFRDENPARIANGMGGTLNVVLSLIYIGAVLSTIIAPIYFYILGTFPREVLWWRIVPACVAALIVVEAVTVIVPMRVGLRRWRKMEF